MFSMWHICFIQEPSNSPVVQFMQIRLTEFQNTENESSPANRMEEKKSKVKMQKPRNKLS